MKALEFYDENLENYNLLNKIDPATARESIKMMEEYHKAELISKVTPIIKSLQDLRIKVYSGQSAFDTEKDIHNIELKLARLWVI